MKVILLSEVSTMVKAGDTVEVAPGYGRNYLIPQKLALPATPGNVRSLQSLLAHTQARRARARQEAEAVASQLVAAPCTIQRPVGEQGKLYGSVTSQDIAVALKQQGIEVDRKTIHLPEPIRTLGQHTVPIRLHPEVRTELTVYVVRKEP